MSSAGKKRPAPPEDARVPKKPKLAPKVALSKTDQRKKEAKAAAAAALKKANDNVLEKEREDRERQEEEDSHKVDASAPPAKEHPLWSKLYTSSADNGSWAQNVEGSVFTTPPPQSRGTLSQLDYYKQYFFRKPLADGELESSRMVKCCAIDFNKKAQCLCEINQGNDASNMVTHLARFHTWVLAREDRTGRFYHPHTWKVDRVSDCQWCIVTPHSSAQR